jgi:pimeloyl-ACP methyl ester carboxylesterase
MDLETLETFRRSVTTAAGEVSYLDVGSGPAALFVHGVGTSALLWRNVIGLLADERRCIALDLPLHGRTPAAPGQDFTLPALAEVVEALRAALSLERVDLVANDTGGGVAQLYAVRYPQHLRTLALTNCDTQGNVPPEAFRPTIDAAAAGQISALLPGLLADPSQLATVRDLVYSNGYADVDRLDPDVAEAFLRPVVGTVDRAREFERFLLAIRDEDLRAIEPQLRHLAVPTLLAWGTDDVFFGPSWARWLESAIPGVTRLAEIEGGRLFLPDERAADLVPLLREHWASAEVGRRLPA